MDEPSWWSLIPPLLAILLAIVTRQVILSLGMGIWIGHCLLEATHPLRGLALAIDGLVAVFADAGDTRVLLFTLVIGGLIATIDRLGGVRGFIRLVESRNWVDSPAKAQWLAWGTGLVIFIESNITLLVAGAVSRPLFDRYRLAREKLAYIIDSTSAPVCILIPFNAWGAVVLGLLAASDIANPIGVFAMAIPLNLYALLAVAVSAAVIARGWDIGPMAAAQRRAANHEADRGGDRLTDRVASREADRVADGEADGLPGREAPQKGGRGSDFAPAAASGLTEDFARERNMGREPDSTPAAAAPPPAAAASPPAAGQEARSGDRASYMLLPVAVLVLSMPAGLYLTGGGDIMAGSGSTAVLWAVLLALSCAWVQSLWNRQLGVEELTETFLNGAGGLLPIAVILLFALALGDVANSLGTGQYVAGIARETVAPVFLVPLIFLVSAAIAFAIGSSWGTFAIMIPLTMQLVLAMALPAHSPVVSLFLAAVLSGAVFGDHASPISDTTVVASLASASNHIDHVRTQLPYALLCAALASGGFFVLGLALL